MLPIIEFAGYGHDQIYCAFYGYMGTFNVRYTSLHH